MHLPKADNLIVFLLILQSSNFIISISSKLNSESRRYRHLNSEKETSKLRNGYYSVTYGPSLEMSVSKDASRNLHGIELLDASSTPQNKNKLKRSTTTIQPPQSTPSKTLQTNINAYIEKYNLKPYQKPDEVIDYLQKFRENCNQEYSSTWSSTSTSYLKPGFSSTASIPEPTKIYDYLKNQANYGNCLFSHQQRPQKCSYEEADKSNNDNNDSNESYNYACLFKYLLTVKEIYIKDTINGNKIFNYTVTPDDYRVIEAQGKRKEFQCPTSNQNEDQDQGQDQNETLPSEDQNLEKYRAFCNSKGHDSDKNDLLFLKFSSASLGDDSENVFTLADSSATTTDTTNTTANTNMNTNTKNQKTLN